MVVDVLLAALPSMSIGVITPSTDTRVGNIPWEEITEPVEAACRRPSFFRVSI